MPLNQHFRMQYVKHYNIHPYNMHCVSLRDGKYKLEQRRMGETTTVPSVQGPIQYHGMLPTVEWRR